MALAIGLFLIAISPLGVEAAKLSGHKPQSTCSAIKSVYKDQACCGDESKVSEWQIVPMPSSMMTGTNPCGGRKAEIGGSFPNVDCLKDGVVQAAEQSGTNVTVGYKGQRAPFGGATPIATHYWEAGLCPVNVHWHLGAEHLSVGEYDEGGKCGKGRRLAKYRKGFCCYHYDASNPAFTTEYNWQHCVDMKVGETYEIHWPHSAAGACGTPYQYQTPFYDGVFCHFAKGIISLDPLNTYSKIGVQGQVFTIINDERYYYPDLIRGMIVDGEMGQDITRYTGSTTGTTRSNQVCSTYTPITWQVDRKCHLISASSFDKMCADMKTQRDDMSDDLYAHGARELVDSILAANNHGNRL